MSDWICFGIASFRNSNIKSTAFHCRNDPKCNYYLAARRWLAAFLEWKMLSKLEKPFLTKGRSHVFIWTSFTAWGRKTLPRGSRGSSHLSMGTTTYKKIDISEEGQKCWKTDSSWNTINVNQSNAVLAINMAHYMAHYSKTKKKWEEKKICYARFGRGRQAKRGTSWRGPSWISNPRLARKERITQIWNS